MTRRTDLLIVGGGLAGGLLTLAMAERRPDVHLTLVDADARFGGNHVWSFFETDVAAHHRWLVEPLVVHRWAETEVRFPGHARILTHRYHSIESERLDAVLRGTLPADRLLNGVAVQALDAAGATLADGGRIEAGAVIDARGTAPGYAKLELGWQKFVGQQLRLERPHGLTRATIMDATVDQADGYRFVYVLPFGSHELFVEDTYYTRDRVLDADDVKRRIARYAAEQGWVVAEIKREEQASLPIAMGGDFDALWPEHDPVPRIGMAAGLFQPMTGYSLPDAVRTAMLVADAATLTSVALAAALRAHAAEAWRSRGFYRLLARLLFQAAEPADRWRVLQRFYRLDGDLIARFYAGRSTALDKLRVLAGKPPVPLGRAIGVLKDHMA